jgi:predicted methyltransferase
MHLPARLRPYAAAFAVVALAVPPVALHAAPAADRSAVTNDAIAAAVADTTRTDQWRALDATRRPAELLAFAKLHKGDRVLDSMSGNGYYAHMISHLVGPSGQVFTWDPPAFSPPIDKLKARYASLGNVTPLLSQADEFAPPPASLDVALFHLTYHDLYWSDEKDGYPKGDPVRFLKAVYAALKPGGTAIVVDHVAPAGGDTRETVQNLHRIDPAVIKADFASAGFKLDAESRMFANPGDDHLSPVWMYDTNSYNPANRGKTDRVVYRFRKPG